MKIDSDTGEFYPEDGDELTPELFRRVSDSISKLVPLSFVAEGFELGYRAGHEAGRVKMMRALGGNTNKHLEVTDEEINKALTKAGIA